MPPTIQTNLSVDREKRPPRAVEKRSELVCKVKYCNTLPDIPFDPKFITYPFESRRFIEYNPTSLERNYKYEVLTEHDLGVTIDLINKDLYTPDFGQSLDPADEILLEEDILTQQDSKRSRHHGKTVSWLRRTEYISTEQTRFQPQTMDKVEAKVGYSIKKNFKDETLYMDRESQIKAIENTFVDSKKPIEKHYSKPNVVPVEILPVFPDFKLWKYPCAQVIFDSDPAPVGRPVPAQIEEMSQAMIRGVMDESGEQFVAYFLPIESTLEKRRADFVNNIEYADEEEYEYKMAREYNWNVKSKASKGYEENYFLVMRPEGVYYNELETRVRLSKRRQKAGQQVNNTRLVVCHRPLNAQEHKMQRYREKQLEPTNEDEEEEEGEEEDETIQEQINDNKSDDEEKDNSDKGKKYQSDSEKDESDREESRQDKETSNGRDDSDKEIDDNKENCESEKDKVDSEKEESENERRGSDKEDSDGERNGSDQEANSVSKEKQREESDEPRSNSSSDSGSASENEDNENKNEEVGRKTDGASHSSGSRSSSRSRSQSRSVQRSRSQSPPRSRSASPPHRSRSGSRSQSPHRSRSASRSQSPQKTRSPSRSRSVSRSGSASGSGSESE